ncbi:otefin-like [Episyrphus balteatus]|uniref:otefin-like n=1 Tax=Episyrphus balteatus TaxID=286459 RepID=UPI002484FA88|nr:otefin-like [Episyrphus balteatus]
MSDDNLESLDNASLRKKCLEYGLPNVPITDTSRKLLIRKLRTAMTGETDDKKKSNRRETIHVTKIPSLVESNANSNTNTDEAPKRPPSRMNRRTIAATSVTSTVDDTTLPESDKTKPITERRRSVRSQVESELNPPAPVIPISQKRKTAVILAEEDEDDEDDVILLEAAEQSEKEIVIPRARRSVSLSKTGVVTTSYSQETVATPPTVNETESESEYDFTSKYASLYEPIARPLAQSQPITRETSYGLSEPKVVMEPDRTLSFRTTSVNRTSIEPEILYNKPLIPGPSVAPGGTSRYSSLGSGYSSSNTASSVTTSSTRRYTSAGGGSGGYGIPTTPAPKYSSMFDDQEENDENQPETPYLSDFARKLERLKAEPLVKGVETPRNVPMKRDTQRFQHSSSIVGRRSTMQTDSSVADSFKNFLFALDRKYKLKRNLSILFVVILILFIYIVFIN